jgi:uncharacterized protein YdaL
MKRLFLIILLSCGLLGLSQPVHAVQASTETPRVLLAYDATDAAENKDTAVPAMQRLLTSAGVRVHVMNISTYKHGMLKAGNYTGVVTLVNWPTMKISNQAFLRDRSQFQGTQLHVGTNLTDAELKLLGAQKQTLYRRQLVLTDAQMGEQLLPYSTDIDVLTRTGSGSTNYGQLTVQGEANLRYPYGTVHGNAGYLPYFDGDGASLVIAEQLVAKLFAPQQKATTPLLTITGVTPYSNLRVLRQTASYLQSEGIGFAISAVSVANNTELSAFDTYAKTLRFMQEAGGVLYLHTPAVGDPGATSGPLLSRTMVNTVTALAQKGVYAVGLSTDTYWNLDALFRKHALSSTTTLLQLANPSLLAYANQDNNHGVYQHAFTYATSSALNSNKSGTALSQQPLTFALPTAVTFSAPTTAKQLGDFKRRVADFQYDWLNPATLDSEVRVGTLTVAQKNGAFYMNGRHVTGASAKVAQAPKFKTPITGVNKFFKLQGQFMWIFFGITLTVMAVLLVIGRRVYKQMYRKD